MSYQVINKGIPPPPPLLFFIRPRPLVVLRECGNGSRGRPRVFLGAFFASSISPMGVKSPRRPPPRPGVEERMACDGAQVLVPPSCEFELPALDSGTGGFHSIKNSLENLHKLVVDRCPPRRHDPSSACVVSASIGDRESKDRGQPHVHQDFACRVKKQSVVLAAKLSMVGSEEEELKHDDICRLGYLNLTNNSISMSVARREDTRLPRCR